MQSFWRRHAHKILIGHGAVIALLTTSMLVETPHAILYFSPEHEHMLVGESMALSINLNTKKPVNAVGMTLVIPPQMEVVGMNTETSFLDLWTEEAVLNKTGRELRFSGGTLEQGGVTGVHTALTLTVRAKDSGEAVFTLKDAEVRAHDGTGDLVTTELRAFSIDIPDAATSPVRIQEPPIEPALNADFDGINGITLADMSILLRHLLLPYEVTYDLNRDGFLSLPDLSVFFGMLPR